MTDLPGTDIRAVGQERCGSLACYEPDAGCCRRLRGQGFSLIELMVTVAILVLVVLIAPPAFDAMLLNSRLTTYANDFVAAAQTARSEAIKRNARVLVCVSSDAATCTGTDWRVGWIAVHDADNSGTFTAGESVLLKHEALNSSYAFTNAAAAATNAIVVYEPTGAVASAVTLKLSRVTPTATQWREIQVSATGRAVINKCPSSSSAECSLP